MKASEEQEVTRTVQKCQGTYRGSHSILLGASKLSGFEPLDDEVERFLASLRFEQREKLAELPIDLSDEAKMSGSSPVTK